MARSPKSLSIENIATTNLVTLDYVVPVNLVTVATLVITNASLNILTIDVFINDGTTDFIFCNVKIPGGIGKKKRIIALSDENLNGGFQIKVQATTNDPFNVFLSGSEISDS